MRPELQLSLGVEGVLRRNEEFSQIAAFGRCRRETNRVAILSPGNLSGLVSLGVQSA